jgi:predicted phosphodiesterase
VRRALLAATCLLVGVVVAVTAFLGGSRTVVIASHDAEVRPVLERQVVLRTGPVLPDFRLPSDAPLGVEVELGKTEAESTDELFQRYALIAGDPEAQATKIEHVVRDIAVSAVLTGLAAGLVPLVVWLLLGARRRAELVEGLRSRRGAGAAVLLLLVPLLVWQPWVQDERTQDESRAWLPLADFVGPAIRLPPEAADIEIRTDPTTQQTRRLIESAVSTYEKSKTFYDAAAASAAELPVRSARDGESVALLVSDRHDNVGMDRVARAIADAAGATAVLDAGDDTSTGEPWEAFSLDSLDRTFDDVDRYAVAGNHDNGGFVPDYLAERGWTVLDGEVVEGPGGTTLLGTHDPRSSGLGSWRDETGLSFADVAARMADEACAAEERVSTVLVHDADLGDEILARGCADLVVGGHTHVQLGPEPVRGSNGEVGYTWTNGTTGGAAYAIAVGSKPRRDAEVSLVTYRDGRPVGLQWVRLRTDGRFVVGPWTPLGYDDSDEDQGGRDRDARDRASAGPR